MKKFSIELVLTLGLGFAACYFLGWWAMPIAAAVSAFFAKNSFGKAFSAGFLAASMLWGGYANFLDSANLSVLSGRVAEIFHQKNGSTLIWATSVLGGVLGGLGAMTGTALRDLVWPEKGPEPQQLFETEGLNG